MRYFEYFDLIPYTITFSDGTTSTFYAKNIFERVKMLDSILSNVEVYYQYSMQDGDTFEIIADKYYGDPNKYWIPIFTNKILDPLWDVPLRYQQFVDYINYKYGSQQNAENIIDHYEKQITKTLTKSANGYYSSNTTTLYYANTTYSIDGSTSLPSIANPSIPLPSPQNITIDNGITLSQTIQLVAVNAYDAESQKNEDRRNINIIDKAYAPRIEAQLKQLLQA
jgi:hypothetical protein